jgi:hypothetical protein
MLAIANMHTQIQEKLDTRRERTWRRWGLVYDSTLLTKEVMNDLKVIRSNLTQINRVEMKRARLDAWHRLRDVQTIKSLNYRMQLLNKERRLVRQSRQHIAAVVKALKQPNALAELLNAMAQREAGLREEIDQSST